MLVLSDSLDFRDLHSTVYRDDTLYYKFYPLSDAPRIRKTDDGRPVFLLTKYAFSDQDRENDSELPTGGGFVNLDVVFALTIEQEAAVRERLQAFVEKEFNRKKNIDSSTEDYSYKGPDAILASPQWVDGAVKFHVVNDPNLVKGKLSEGKPSMFGVNNAIFNASLTPAGATYFQKTLTDEDGGGINLTPIQVEYELSFMRRLPPLSCIVYGNTTEVYHAVSELSHDYNDHWWGSSQEDKATTTESYTESLFKSKAVYMKIDTGEYAADSDEVEEIRSFAMGQLTNWLQENLFERITKFDPTYPDIEDVYSKEEDVYRLKTIDQVTSSTLYLDLTQTSLVPFTIHPQATLESFFADMSPEEIAQHVREVSLEDKFFTTLDMNVKAFADFSEVQYVKVDIEYDGSTGLKTKSFNFDNNDAVPGNWDPMLNDGNREYRWRYEVAFKSNPDATIVSAWEPETTRQLNINVGRPGELTMSVLAGQVDWENLVEQVQIELSYEDSSNDINKESATMILTKDTPSTDYQRWLYKMQEKPVEWRAKYFLKNGQEIDGDTQYTNGEEIVINDTFIDTLEVLVVPAGKIDYVNQVIVDLRYEDRSSDYANIKHFAISKSDFLGTWRVPLINKNCKDWEWKSMVLYKDGTHEESSWEEKEGSQSIPVSWQSPPSVDIIVNPILLKFDKAPAVEVTLTYKGNVIEGEGDDNPATFIFEDKTKQNWNLRVEDESVKDYDWEVIYYVEPESVTIKGSTNKRTFLIPRVPTSE